MFLFRVSPSLEPVFNTNDIIKPNGGYSKFLGGTAEDSTAKQKVENALRQCYSFPEVNRCSSLFLFHELKDAFVFSSKIHKGNARIYAVKPAGRLSRRDMNILDVLNYAINRYEWGKCACRQQCVNDICDSYWKNLYTFAPCLEYMVDSATVISLVSDQNTCLKFHSQYSTTHLKSFMSVERCPTYVKTLSEVMTDGAEDAGLKLFEQFKAKQE